MCPARRLPRSEFLFALLLFLPFAVAHAASPARRAAPSAAQSPQLIDNARRMDVNRLNMWTTNYGAIAWDLTTGNSGLEYPKGSGKTAVFAAGLWLGAHVNGNLRVTVAEYSQEYGPGAMSGGTFTNPALPQYHTYKVVPWQGNPADTGHVVRLAPGPLEDPLEHHGWSEYMAGAVPYGAPWQNWLLPDPNNVGGTVSVPGPADLGHQILWSVFNDADPSNHTNQAGNSTPLGVEVQQTVLGVNSSGAAGYATVVRYRVINKGSQQLDDVIATFWMDPDIGGASDDLVGSDPALQMVYGYNANNADFVYGSTPPAVGVMLLEGPKTALGDTIPAAAAVRFIGGTDPANPSEAYNYMLGRNADGTAAIDPTTLAPKTFWLDGDPVQGTGWLDTNPTDRRMMLSTGMFSMAPGDTQEFTFAIVLGQGNNRLASISALKANATAIWNGGTPPPPPPVPTNCPRPVAYWATQCPPSTGDLTPVQMAAITAMVGNQSLLFDWAPGSETTSFCETLSPPGPIDLRTMAKTEYAALLANWAAGQLGVTSADGQPIQLLETNPVSCPGSVARSVGEMILPAYATPSLEATYENDNAAHRRALTGVNWGGASFFGGADFGWNFWGGSLIPNAMPDSFPRVDIRFDQNATQKAYRYLRLEQANESAPAGGREYRYGGFHEVPFQVWDVEHNVQLDVAFVERTVTDAAGTIQPPGAQVATFDSTWAPDASSLGGREYLFILHTPYSPTPKAPFEVDDAMDVVPMPIVYALWAVKRVASDVIDDGDRMRFVSGPYSGVGVDTQLLNLESKPLGDAWVQDAYTQLIDCMRNLNTGVSIENPCDQPTAIQLSLVTAEADADRVSLVWYSPQPGFSATVERREEAGDWEVAGQVLAEASGMIRFIDTAVVPGRHYDYRLAFLDEGTLTRAGQVSVVVPVRAQLSLAGFVPNPARDRATVEFVLPVKAPATLEVLDLQSRRIVSREVGHLGPGRATVTLSETGTLRPGIYVIRLRQGGAAVSRKAVVVR